MVGWLAFVLLWVMGIVPSAVACDEAFPSATEKEVKIPVLIFWPLAVLVVVCWIGVWLASDGWCALKAYLSRAKN